MIYVNFTIVYLKIPYHSLYILFILVQPCVFSVSHQLMEKQSVYVNLGLLEYYFSFSPSA